jgi:transcriptional regulator with XRE-family HTH domain
MDDRNSFAAITGHDLRMARLDANVTARSLARELGVSYQRVNAIEGSRRPTDRAAERYWRALLAASRQ